MKATELQTSRWDSENTAWKEQWVCWICAGWFVCGGGRAQADLPPTAAFVALLF